MSVIKSVETLDINLDFIKAEEEWNEIEILPILKISDAEVETNKEIIKYSKELLIGEDDDEDENECQFLGVKENESKSVLITIDEIDEYFHNYCVDEYKLKINPMVKKNLLQRIFEKLLFLGPPNLLSTLINERDHLFSIALCPFNNNCDVQFKFLRSIYFKLTENFLHKCPRYGTHWETIGFQGNDPATDFRGVGLLGLYNILFLLYSPYTEKLSKDIYQLSIDIEQNFPFSVMSTNITQIALQTLRNQCLNQEINKRKNVVNTFNFFYAGLYLRLYLMWKERKITIIDTGFVLKDLRLYARKNVHAIIESIFIYEKKIESNLLPSLKIKNSNDIVEFSNIGSLL